MWHEQSSQSPEKKIAGLAEKAYLLIQQKRMKDIDRQTLTQQIQQASASKDFNLYRFVEKF
jgi:LAO/AO transport system kinase